jgi:hypothetical protein
MKRKSPFAVPQRIATTGAELFLVIFRCRLVAPDQVFCPAIRALRFSAVTHGTTIAAISGGYITGPPRSATRIGASIAACHSGASCTVFGSSEMY